MVLRIAYDSKTIWPAELDTRQLFSFATATTQQHVTVELQWQNINWKMLKSSVSKWRSRTNTAIMQLTTIVWPEHVATLSRQCCSVPSYDGQLVPHRLHISGDTQCALGERCISATERDLVKVCIKICFYDAHCLGRRDSGDRIMTKRKNLEGVVVFSAHVF